ncbi:glycosyltransferase family 2 protein [Paenibacillus luteus]|uniref:glycosyltransferase family 2 protein n=1 Tax=Paenibacillus luteus TaxID=2545753 RepID=UPI001143C24F|nr:glycosyltransferase family 2 protein [Paenibacillus luteus]
MRRRSLRKRKRPRIIRKKNRAVYQARYAAGYRDGRVKGAASYHEPFAGTSIIIPTYNQLGYLRGCIESIQRYTNEPYEIIIIDNGSTDGTPAYLKSYSGMIRYKILPRNLGFSGGVNQGLMMAKGTTIVILNNDTLVTTNWLSNLLLCLRSDPSIGLVGPVTNYLSNDQKIEVNYKNMVEMQSFAQNHNQSNPQRWRRSKGIMGFCLLLTREVLQRVGYFDEGYVIGTCEDVDYYLRIRLLGLDLVVAEDTFIHHYGSVTMRSFLDASLLNNAFFLEKWGDWEKIGRLEKVMDSAFFGQQRKGSDFYPSHILVTGTDSKLYWVENGLRYVVHSSNAPRNDAVRLPQLELWNWPIGGDISEAAVQQKINALSVLTTAITEGGFVITQDGEIHQLTEGKLHRMTTKQAFKAWGLEHRYIRPLTEGDKKQFSDGLPIIAPPIIKADNI